MRRVLLALLRLAATGLVFANMISRAKYTYELIRRNHMLEQAVEELERRILPSYVIAMHEDGSPCYPGGPCDIEQNCTNLNNATNVIQAALPPGHTPLWLVP